MQYPFEHYLAILCLESHLANVPIVGENLGIVPAEVDAALATHQLLGTWVAYGAIDGARDGRPLEDPASWSLATVNTHDMPTFRGYVDGSDLQIRFELGLIDAETLAALRIERDDDVRAAAALLCAAGVLEREHQGDPTAIYRALLRSLAPATRPIVLANLEDLWGEAEQQNVPGTTGRATELAPPHPPSCRRARRRPRGRGVVHTDPSRSLIGRTALRRQWTRQRLGCSGAPARPVRR